MANIAVSVVCADVLTFSADVLVLKHAEGLYGADAAAYARLTQDGTVVDLPAFGESRLAPSLGKVASDHVMFIGVGPLYAFEYPRIRDFSRSALSATAAAVPTARHIALTLHGPGYGLDEMEALEAELAGLADGVRTGTVPRDLVRVTIVEFERRRAERLAARVRELFPDGIIQSGAGDRHRAQGAENTIRDAGYASTRKRRVFVAMPFQPEMDDAYDYGISRPANDCGYLCERADREIFTDDVVLWIKERIRLADLIIADVTGANANVYLEVGYAWGLGRQTMLISRSADDLKFDVKTQRCFVYRSIKELEQQVKKVLLRLDA